MVMGYVKDMKSAKKQECKILTHDSSWPPSPTRSPAKRHSTNIQPLVTSSQPEIPTYQMNPALLTCQFFSFFHEEVVDLAVDLPFISCT